MMPKFAANIPIQQNSNGDAFNNIDDVAKFRKK
jgi:hypothetical protein